MADEPRGILFGGQDETSGLGQLVELLCNFSHVGTVEIVVVPEEQGSDPGGMTTHFFQQGSR